MVPRGLGRELFSRLRVMQGVGQPSDPAAFYGRHSSPAENVRIDPQRPGKLTNASLNDSAFVVGTTAP